MGKKTGVKRKILYYTILDYQPENKAILDKHFYVITLKNPDEDNREILKEVDVIIVPLGFYLGRDKIDKAPNLRIIASNTTGVPHIDVEYAEQKGIRVISLKDYQGFLRSITPTAELTWGLILALTRRIPWAFHSVCDGEWNRRLFGGVSMLSRMSLGIAGLGRLGSMVASYGKCFGMKVNFYDPYVTDPLIPGLKRADTLEELVEDNDIVSIHIPHKPETEKLFNEEIFSKFKQGSFLINTSRGELIDFSVLLRSLQNKVLAGAALDVFEGEYEEGFSKKYITHPLLEYARKHDNLIITPHIGGSTCDAWRLTEEFTLRKVIEALE
jgi:D-3-phosphoglycerate dehydrogenase|tara:strand:+ start:282 stop:1262 length:981 start_codon:yes stop_codon:yes gene_type:complete